MTACITGWAHSKFGRLSDETLESMIVKVAREALEIAAARNIRVGRFNGRSPAALVKTLHLPNWAYRLVMQFIVKIDDQARSSMLDDLEAGRASEIEYLQGEIMRQAKMVGLAVPKNETIRTAVETAFKAGKSRISAEQKF